MQVAGIIAEYDPFHKGHAAHIEATRAAGATHIVAVMSGGFTQRGEPALLSKWQRVQMALQGGIDLVLELPVPWAMAPAETFATGGVTLLQALGCVHTLSFGSECGDADRLCRLAKALDAPQHRALLRKKLSDGLSYAAARQATAEALCGEEEGALLSHPNNTLGLEYIRAATRLGADFRFFTLKRVGAAHDAPAPTQGYASAGLLRQWVREGRVAQAVACMPPACGDLLQQAVADGQAPGDATRLHTALLARLRTMTAKQMEALPYLSEGLHNRLYRESRTATDYEALLQALQTKRYPLARLRRILWAALLELDDRTDEQPPYLRVLGMNDRGREILAAASPTLPLLSRPGRISALGKAAQAVFNAEQRATDLQGLTLPIPLPCGTDLTVKFHHI